jgi:carboxymethylenebutenolidase
MLHAPPRIPIILHYGRNDHGIPMSEVEKVAAAFPDVPIHLYDAGHGFCRAGSADFDEPSCELAMERTLALFAASSP